MERRSSAVTRSEFFERTGHLQDGVDALKGSLNRLAMEVIGLKEHVHSMEERMMTKDMGERMIQRFDSIAEWIVTSKDKEPVQDHRLLELEEKSANHETRLTRLESNRP